MGTAVVWETSERVELVGETIAGLMQARIPHSRRITGCARDCAVVAGVPDPFDFVARLDRNCRGRKDIAAGADVDREGFRERALGQKNSKRASDDGETCG